MADEKKYLEGNYDGEPVQQAVQMTADVVRAVNMPKEIRAVQEAVYEKETERLSYEEKATGERFEELMRNYIEKDKYHQYLVDGAVLRCTAATTDDFTYAEGETVVLENKDDEVCNITLDVHENPMSVNHLIYATVKDTVQQINITPPKCNCRLAVNRNAERKRIIDNMERNKNGVCRHLMDLNGTWDNFEVDGTTYLKKVNAVINLFPSEDGKGIVEGPGDIIGEEDGITMTSVLFCKHGGLIMPVTSGQENIIPDTLEDRIQALVAGVEGKPINSRDEMFALSTMEILSRLIYQEASRKCGSGQNAILFSLVNRLFTETNVTRRTKANNLYSIITGSGQYESVLREGTYSPNSYKPPIGIDSISDEVIPWENAKRLAAILYIAIEDYGEENEYNSANDRNESVVRKGDQDIYQQVVDFIENQTDTEGNHIINEIGIRESLVAGDKEIDQGIYIGGNTFYCQ